MPITIPIIATKWKNKANNIPNIGFIIKAITVIIIAGRKVVNMDKIIVNNMSILTSKIYCIFKFFYIITLNSYNYTYILSYHFDVVKKKFVIKSY